MSGTSQGVTVNGYDLDDQSAVSMDNIVAINTTTLPRVYTVTFAIAGDATATDWDFGVYVDPDGAGNELVARSKLPRHATQTRYVTVTVFLPAGGRLSAVATTGTVSVHSRSYFELV